jgi:hypothetical protein
MTQGAWDTTCSHNSCPSLPCAACPGTLGHLAGAGPPVWTPPHHPPRAPGAGAPPRWPRRPRRGTPGHWAGPRARPPHGPWTGSGPRPAKSQRHDQRCPPLRASPPGPPGLPGRTGTGAPGEWGSCCRDAHPGVGSPGAQGAACTWTGLRPRPPGTPAPRARWASSLRQAWRTRGDPPPAPAPASPQSCPGGGWGPRQQRHWHRPPPEGCSIWYDLRRWETEPQVQASLCQRGKGIPTTDEGGTKEHTSACTQHPHRCQPACPPLGKPQASLSGGQPGAASPVGEDGAEGPAGHPVFSSTVAMG